MLETGSTGDTVEIPDIDADGLIHLRNTMDTARKRNPISMNGELLEMCMKYEMPDAAVSLLRRMPPPVQYDDGDDQIKADRTAYFLWASRLDCPDVAVRLFLSFNSYPYIDDNMVGGDDFDAEFADRLSPRWVWAAERARSRAKPTSPTPHYWQRFGLFFAQMF